MVIYGSSFDGGTVKIPPSKSAAHRALLAAALTGGACTVENIIESDDMLATLGAIQALGATAEFDRVNQSVFIDAKSIGHTGGEIDCLASGSTLRFMIPIAAAFGGEYIFTGRDRLPERPIGVYTELLPAHGVACETDGGLPLKISGKLEPGKFSLPGNVSSQFITGLLLALPLLEGDSDIQLTTALESESYVNLTISVLKDFGIQIETTPTGWHVAGNQKFSARTYQVEGDWSQAAFFLCMAALSPTGEKIRIEGLKQDSVQGDRACVERFEAFGLHTAWENGALTAQNLHAERPFGGLKGQTIDVSQIPDMVPALAVCGALAQGETHITNAARLRIKESDRLAAMEEAISALGGYARCTEDELTITGVENLTGGTAQGKADHRVVMALAAAALRSTGPVQVTDEQSIRKSYPDFFKDFTTLGGSAHVQHLG